MRFSYASVGESAAVANKRNDALCFNKAIAPDEPLSEKEEVR